MAEELGARGLGPSRTGLWTVRLLLGFVYAALVAGGVELWVAFSLVGVEHEASTMQVHLFLAFAIAAVLLEPVLLLDGRERLLVGWAVVVGREV